MLTSFRFMLTLLLVFSFSATLMGNEWANYYFPDALESYWHYEDQDGNELTRYAVAQEDIDGETYRAFSYAPQLEDWKDYQYYVHPYFYRVGDEWVAFFVGEDVENATKAITAQQWDEVIAVMRQQMQNQLPPGINVDINMTYELEVEAQDYFYFLPTPATFNEEWEAMRADIKMDLNIGIQSDLAGFPSVNQNIMMYLTVVETGNVVDTETVETEAGTFEDCLKIEYRADATIETSPPIADAESMFSNAYGETLTTLWLAPNVGIVKFSQESEALHLEKTLELTQFELKSAESGSDSSNQ